jgi:hypothetical protein
LIKKEVYEACSLQRVDITVEDFLDEICIDEETSGNYFSSKTEEIELCLNTLGYTVEDMLYWSSEGYTISIFIMAGLVFAEQGFSGVIIPVGSHVHLSDELLDALMENATQETLPKEGSEFEVMNVVFDLQEEKVEYLLHMSLETEEPIPLDLAHIISEYDEVNGVI